MKVPRLRVSAIALTACVFATNLFAANPNADLVKNAPAFFKERGAEVLKAQMVPGGLIAYTVRKNGSTAIFYTPPDKSVLLVGAMFDAKSGTNLSDKIMPSEAVAENSRQLSMEPTPQPAGKDLDKAFKAAPLQDAVDTGTKSVNDPTKLRSQLLSEKVVGVQEGKPSEKTVFVFFDPLCGYCHNLVENTRAAVKGGASIKWIAVNTQGDVGLSKTNELLRKGQSALLPMARGELNGITMNSAESARITYNTVLLLSMTKQLGVKAATPTILFPNPKSTTGKYTIAQGDGSDPALLQAMFGTSK